MFGKVSLVNPSRLPGGWNPRNVILKMEGMEVYSNRLGVGFVSG